MSVYKNKSKIEHFGINVWFSLMLLFVTLMAGVILASTRANAETDAVDSVSITVLPSCTMSASGTRTYSTSINPGIYSQGIGNVPATAFCNDNEGFAIYAVGFTNDTYGNNKLIGTTDNTHEIVTGTATGPVNNVDTSNWAMKITTDSNATYPLTINSDTNGSFGSYHIVPTAYTKIAYRTAATDVGTGATGATFNTNYAVYVSNTQPTDTYTGKVKYTLVHPSSDASPGPQTTASGEICYYRNSSDVVGTMGCQTIGTSDGTTSTSATLLASNFSRQGYGFAGWSDVFDYDTNSNAHFYGPQEYIEFTEGQYSGNNDGLSLYAVWVPSAGSFQDSTKIAELCGSSGSLISAPIDGTANLESVSALTDQRDNETYAIAKLADGKCWMIENLRLESENTTSSEDIALAQGYGSSTTYGNFIGLADAQSANDFAITAAANSLYSSDGSTVVTIKGGNSSYYYARMPRYNNYNNQFIPGNRPQNPTINTASNNISNAGMYSYGNYYSWPAALANIINYTSKTAQVNGKTSETVNTSICPYNWRLPYGSINMNTGSFYRLNYIINNNSNVTNATASKKIRSFPNNFVYAGSIEVRVMSRRGTVGRYWSSTANSANSANSLYLSNNEVNPTDGGDNSYGKTIRCVLLSV